MNEKPVDHEFLALIDRHQNIIHRVCALYAVTAEDRKDLFQEILFQAWRAYPSFQQRARFSTWMYRIALNTAITGFRKTKRKPEHVPIAETYWCGKYYLHRRFGKYRAQLLACQNEMLGM